MSNPPPLSRSLQVMTLAVLAIAVLLGARLLIP
jgi:hypothetical protein